MKKHDIMFCNPDEENVIQKLYDHKNFSKIKQGYVPSYIMIGLILWKGMIFHCT